MADCQKHSDISTAPALVALAETEAQSSYRSQRATERQTALSRAIPGLIAIGRRAPHNALMP